MRIAFLCKRRYMGKDVIDDRYARLYELPHQLARLGHDVLVLCVGYQGQADGESEHEALTGRLRFVARGIRSPWISAILGYPSWAEGKVRSFAPDIIMGASDIPNIVLASRLARRLSIPLVVDLYDNFESFGQARIPGMVTALRRATRRAAVVTTTSESLADYVRSSYRAKGVVVALPSTVDKAIFHPRDRAESRRVLGLPTDAILVGTAGGLHRAKGIGELFDAWTELSTDPRIHLVLAGPMDGSVAIPTGDRVHYLGQLPHDGVASFFSALNVATVCVLDTPFGRYCFPQKAYEILATGTPVVASAVGDMKHLLRTTPQLLYRAGDVHDLADRIRQAIDHPVTVDVTITDWAGVICNVEPQLLAAALQRRVA
jgi:glycosyltransferase involved in cell wall biosynthesis